MAMTLRLTEELSERLRETADREGVSMQAAAIKAVEEYTSKRAATRAELLDRILTEDADVLRRLSDA